MSKRPGKLRRAGARWRILVHRYVGGDGPAYDHAYHVQDDRWGEGDQTGEHSSVRVLAHTEFDELVIGGWIRLEQMDSGTWWANVGGVTLWVKADRDGKPISVSIHGPGDYASPEPGCTYHLNWTAPDEWTAPLGGDQ